MSKLERLNARVAKLLTEAVQEVLEVVKETVSEYQQKTVRTQRENESLKRRVQELQDKITKESTTVLPASRPLPKEKQDTENHGQNLSLAQRHNSGVTLTEHNPASSQTPDHDVKQECKEQESYDNSESEAEYNLVQTSTEQCKAQPEEGTLINEEALTVQTSHRANRDPSSVSSNNLRNTHSISLLGVNLAAIKREAEPTDCATSEPPPLQEQYSGCMDLSCNSSRHNSAETFRPQDFWRESSHDAECQLCDCWRQ
ncbi:uncharacterized protein [Trachinotus anak]|uniref:uncharacterized protein isoform X1 n=1 Tax=Trachinotus anak TaxID=443729 RepID=UPI0039F17D2D